MMLFDYDFDKDQEIFTGNPSKPDLIDCSDCSKKFSSKQNLELHRVFQHKILFFKCPKINCNKSFFREDYLNEHINIIHNGGKIAKPYKCQKARKCIDNDVAFKTLGELNQHLKRHGPKNYICDICKKGFAMKAYLETHKRSHTGEKVHSCRYKSCNEKFVHSSSRQLHEKQHYGGFFTTTSRLRLDDGRKATTSWRSHDVGFAHMSSGLRPDDQLPN
jgi:uncharacterized Zn-finger protein